MVWIETVHPQFIEVCQLSAQPDTAKIPVSDRDVLLDHNLPLLPDDQGRQYSSFLPG